MWISHLTKLLLTRLHVCSMMLWAPQKLILINIALNTAAVIGALDMPETQCTYALSPCLRELIKHDLSARRSPFRTCGLDISQRKAFVPGMNLPHSPSGSACTRSGEMAKQKICMLGLVSSILSIPCSVGSGPSQSSPLPSSSQTLATSLGGSGLGRLPRPSYLASLSLDSHFLIMESSLTWLGV